MTGKLTEKQQRFLDAYLGTARYNATEAARMAGDAGHRVTLAQIGSKTRRTPQVVAAIEAEMMVTMVVRYGRKTSQNLTFSSRVRTWEHSEARKMTEDVRRMPTTEDEVATGLLTLVRL